jgi:hypothetical protein
MTQIKKQISKVELERLYGEMRNEDLMVYLGVSPANFYRLLKRAGIGLKAGDRKPSVKIQLID